MKIRIGTWDKFLVSLFPRWGMERLRAKMVTRHYEAAQVARRSKNWNKATGDSNAVNLPALAGLRALARDLVRNNAWAQNAVDTIEGNTVGTGIIGTVTTAKNPEALQKLWNTWANSTQPDPERKLTFGGIQALAMKSIVRDGEILIRRRTRKISDGFAVPLQLQVLEADYLDTGKNDIPGTEGGVIRQGVETNGIGQIVAYWLFPQHPGSAQNTGTLSNRVPASEIAHVFRHERGGQARGMSWFPSAVVPLKDFDEYEDSTLVRQKIAAMFAGFVTDPQGDASGIGLTQDEDEDEQEIEQFEPGMIQYLTPGKDIKFGSPPAVEDAAFRASTLRKIAAGIGVTYEDMTGDYSQVNFSSARMGRLSHYKKVEKWQWLMLVPQLCDRVFGWFAEAAQIAGTPSRDATVAWTVPPIPMIEPDKEGLAVVRKIRGGLITPSQAVREQGYDPATFFKEYAADFAQIRAAGVTLDSDVAAVSQAGLMQARAGAAGGSGGGEQSATPPEIRAEDHDVDFAIDEDIGDVEVGNPFEEDRTFEPRVLKVV
jgi:lambda family phage portal protein